MDNQQNQLGIQEWSEDHISAATKLASIFVEMDLEGRRKVSSEKLQEKGDLDDSYREK